MSGNEAIETISVPAEADLTALQFTAVRWGTGKQIVSATANSAPVLGILQNKPNTGQAGCVAISGIAKAKAGGAWGSGDALTPTTGGALIATTSNNHFIIGYAHEDAASGDVAQVRIAPGQFGA